MYYRIYLYTDQYLPNSVQILVLEVAAKKSKSNFPNVVRKSRVELTRSALSLLQTSIWRSLFLKSFVILETSVTFQSE